MTAAIMTMMIKILLMILFINPPGANYRNDEAICRVRKVTK